MSGGALVSGAAWRTVAAAQATPVAGPGEQAAALVGLTRQAMTDHHLRAVIVRVTIDGEEIVTVAFGESMTGVPATPVMRFRNGAVAITYMSMALLILVDQGLVSLDDPIVTWAPELPNADQVTLRMLANMTSGYPDFVPDAQFEAGLYADPFRHVTTEEQLAAAFRTPPIFPPGTNWNYAHTNYVILGQIMERITGRPLDALLRDLILDPLRLRATTGAVTAVIPDPVLHAFSSERRQALGIPDGTRFYEESTFWDPSWTLAHGAIQTTDIFDMATSAEAIGEGVLLSPESHRELLDSGLLGFGEPVAGCPACRTLNEQYNYGLGIVLHGDWLLQNPLFSGYAGLMAYLPSERIAIAVAVTFAEAAFDEAGSYSNSGTQVFTAIAGYLAPDSLPAQS
jgi:CubicO group peptidase (beta-lactamase class C family)